MDRSELKESLDIEILKGRFCSIQRVPRNAIETHAFWDIPALVNYVLALFEGIREQIIKEYEERGIYLGTAILEEAREQGREEGIQAVIDYLKNEVATVEERSAGGPKLKAHFNAMEKGILGTVVNALEEWLKEGK